MGSGRIAEFRRRSEAMLLQWWNWGLDIQENRRKLFSDYGFERFPPPKDVGGKSMYCRDLGDGRFLCLWSWGLLLGQTGKESQGQQSWYLEKGRLKPRVAARKWESIPTAYMTREELKLSRAASSVDAASAMLVISSEIERHEGFVRQALGEDYLPYRERCRRRWDQGSEARSARAKSKLRMGQ